MSTSKWFAKGEDGEKFVAEQEEKRKALGAAKSAKDWRFKLGYGETGFIVVLDDLTFFFNEHQYEKMENGKRNFYNYETCIKDIEGECPFCENNIKFTPVGAMTIIDLTEYKKKDGTLSKPAKKLIVLKQGGRERFLRKQKKLGGLAFKKFEIYRSKDEKGEATGTDVEYEKDVDLEVLKKLAPEGQDPNEWIKPYNYEELFAPKSAAELRQIMGLSEPVGASETNYEEPEKKSIKDLL